MGARVVSAGRTVNRNGFLRRGRNFLVSSTSRDKRTPNCVQRYKFLAKNIARHPPLSFHLDVVHTRRVLFSEPLLPILDFFSIII